MHSAPPHLGQHALERRAAEEGPRVLALKVPAAQRLQWGMPPGHIAK